MKVTYNVSDPPPDYWKPLLKYPTLEIHVMKEILLTGYSHASVLRVAFGINRFRLNDALRNLWREGYIHRDVKGLVISKYHTECLPHFKNWLQSQFKVTLT